MIRTSALPFRLYSPECVEGTFSEVRVAPVDRLSTSWDGTQPRLQRLGGLNREKLAEEHFARQRENQRKADEAVTQGAQEHTNASVSWRPSRRSGRVRSTSQLFSRRRASKPKGPLKGLAWPQSRSPGAATMPPLPLYMGGFILGGRSETIAPPSQD